MEYKKIRISIKNIRQNGVLCPNPTVAWITQPGIFYPCIGKDYIEVEVPAGADPRIEFVIQCDDCDACPPEHIVRYMCDTSHDCDDCEICNEHGYCEPLCPDELCIDGTCVDCVDDDDCPSGMICVGGKCICPPTRPYLNRRGECVACLTDAECPKCYHCQGGDCVPLDCGDGVCDPVTGKCVECVTTGDCDGPNECCYNNKCECCPGYIWDHTLQQCVARNECYSDSDCAVCEVCVNGSCEPLQVPSGYIAVPVGDECFVLRECECGSGDCPPNHACVDYKDGICVCVDCTDTCTTDNDCGDGCLCADGGICVPSPCYGKCDNAADCGEGCGCEDGECVPCSKYDCIHTSDECEAIPGCDCVGYKCSKTRGDCEGECTSAYDCGEGCGCYNGECYPCSWFDCDDDGECDSIPGCKCDGAANCIDDDSPRGDKDACPETLAITKDEESCDLIATLSGVNGCACSPISLGMYVTKVEKPGGDYLDVTFKAELRKGNANNYIFESLPLLNATSNPLIADNETPSYGLVNIYTQNTYRHKLTKEVANGPNTSQGSISMAGVAAGSMVVSIAKLAGYPMAGLPVVPGEEPEENKWEVIAVAISYEYSAFEYPNNCDYSGGDINGFTHKVGNDLATLTTYSNLFKYTVKTSTGSRNPMFIWSKTSENVFKATDVFRKYYVDRVGSTYVDTLYGMGKIPTNGILAQADSEGELWNNRDYKVEADCSCAKPAVHDNLYFCNPQDWTGIVQWVSGSCNRKVLIENFTPCDMNKARALYQEAGYNIPSDTQAQYFIYANGTTLIRTVTHDAVSGKMKDGNIGLPWTYSSNKQIDSITIKLGFDGQPWDVCVWDFDATAVVKPELVTTSSLCQNGYYVYTITKPTIPDAQITNISWDITDVSIVEDTDRFELTIPSNTALTLTIAFDDNCIYDYYVGANICTGLEVDLDISELAHCEGDADLTATVTNGVGPFAYVFTVPNTTGGVISKTTIVPTATFPAGTFGVGQATVAVQDFVGQTATDSEYISPATYTFSATEAVSVCTNGTYTITVTATPGATVTSDIPGHTTFVIPLSGVYTITLTAGATANTTVYTYGILTIPSRGIGLPNCAIALEENTVVTTVTTPSATLTATAPTVCATANTTAAITGTVGSTVSILIENLTLGTTVGTYPVYLAGGTGSIALPTTQGHYRITKQSVTLGACVNTATSYFDVSVFSMPIASILQGTYACSEDLTSFEVQFTSSHTPTTPPTVGSIVTLGAGLYKFTNVPSETSSTVTITNGACSTTLTTAAYECTCAGTTVDAPVGNPASYDYCDNEDVPTLTVTSTHTVNWYSASIGGTLLQAGSTTYIPDNADVGYGLNVYYAEAENALGCTSARTPIYLTKFSAPGVTIDPKSTVYCPGTDVIFDIIKWNTSSGGAWASNAVFEQSLVDESITLTVPDDKVYFWLSYTVDNASGCTTTALQYYLIDDDCGPEGPTGESGATGECEVTACALQYFEVTENNTISTLYSDVGSSCSVEVVMPDCSDPAFEADLVIALAAIDAAIQACYPDCDWGTFSIEADSEEVEGACIITISLINSPILFDSALVERTLSVAITQDCGLL